MERGQLDGALSYFQKALAIRSGSEHRHYNLSLAIIHDSTGNVLALKGRLDEAIAAHQKAIALAPDFAALAHAIGGVFVRRRFGIF